MNKQKLEGLAPAIIKERLEQMTIEEFVQWINDEYLDPHEHGRFCKIHEMEDDGYWTYYLRPLGYDIAWGVAEGVNRGAFSKTERYVQYIDVDNFFLTFDDKEQFFSEVWPLDAIVDEMSCRG